LGRPRKAKSLREGMNRMMVPKLPAYDPTIVQRDYHGRNGTAIARICKEEKIVAPACKLAKIPLLTQPGCGYNRGEVTISDNCDAYSDFSVFGRIASDCQFVDLELSGL